MGSEVHLASSLTKLWIWDLNIAMLGVESEWNTTACKLNILCVEWITLDTG